MRSESRNLVKRALLKHAGRLKKKGKGNKRGCCGLRGHHGVAFADPCGSLGPAFGVTHGPAPSWQAKVSPLGPCQVFPGLFEAAEGLVPAWHSAVLTTRQGKKKRRWQEGI